MGHRHAELMKQYAEDAIKEDKPWYHWEYKDPGKPEIWQFCKAHPEWNDYSEYRRMQKTVMINGIECDDDFVYDPSNRFHYYIESPGYSEFYRRYAYDIDRPELKMYLHTTKDGAIQACKARLGIKND